MEAFKILASTARAMSYNMVLQVGIRLMTFMFNAVILRYISQDLLSVLNVRLTLLYSTILFLTKEAFERACLSRREGQDWRHVINLIWCTVPLGLVIGTALSLVWLYVLERPDAAVVGDYGVGVVAFAASACIEVVAEPLYVTGQAFFFVKLKVLALGLSQAVKCGLSLLLVLVFPNLSMYGFALAHLLSSACYVALYCGYFAHYFASQQEQNKEKRKKKTDDDIQDEKREKENGDGCRDAAGRDDDCNNNGLPCATMGDFLPRIVPGEKFFDVHLVHLTWSFFKQSLFKQILTEGGRYVMTFLNVLSFADQGIYDVINNLGSLVARFIFLPIEENGYIFFSQSLARGKPAREQTEGAMSLSSRVLTTLLKIVTYIGCTVIVFGYANSSLALRIYGGERLSSGSGPTLLRWYCLYVLGLAVNGVTEGFVFATMSREQVDRYNRKMLLFSALFLTAAWLLTARVGSVGFILANCFNMALRISHSIVFIRGYFEGTEHKPLSSALPSPAVVATLVKSLIATALSEKYLLSRESLWLGLAHIAVSGVCLIIVFGAVLYTEESMVQAVKKIIKQQRDRGKEHVQ